MKRIISMLALLLAGSLALSGCAAMLERSHVSSTAHVDYAVEDYDESVLRAETYQGLVNSLRYFIDEHRSGGVIRLYNYTGDVETDLASARDEVLQEPVGAFAVGALNYDSTRILTYYEVKLTISYTRTAREVEAIPEVFGLSGVQQELSRLVTERQKSAVFMASYFSGDVGMVEKLFVENIYNVPALFCYPAGPEADLDYEINLYPKTGTRRIVEVTVSWRDDAREAEELERTASALLEANPPAGEGYTVEELAAIVRAAHGGQDGQGSRLPRDVLSGETASDLGLLMAMEYLCRQCGIEAVMVWGQGPQTSWLIVSTPGGYRHLPVDCLYARSEDPEAGDPDGDDPDGEDPEAGDPDGENPDGEEPENPFALYTDREMTELGYEWPASLYPACEEPEPSGELELS